MTTSNPAPAASRNLARALLIALALVSPSGAVETRTWTLSEAADFEKGKLKGLSLASDGRLTLAPSFREIFDASTAYLWTAAEDSKGNLYVGGGNPTGSTARLFVIDPAGKSRVLSELAGLEIHALAVNRKDEIYAATSPDGKVYRVRAGKPEVFYDPKAKYVWAMAFSGDGSLFVATGDQGEIHKVTPAGAGQVFFKTEETHARSLAIDAKDNLIVGTEPGGLILRVSPAGEGFVLHQAPKREVTAVAVAKDGSVYAAAVGNKLAPGLAPPPIQTAPTPVASPIAGALTTTQRQPSAPPPTLPAGAAPPSISGGSEVYRIDPEGFPRRVWSDPQEIVYAIGFDALGRPLLGCGNKGSIHRLDSDILSTLLVSAQPTQVTGFSASRNGALYVLSGNLGKVYQLGPGLEKEGSFESDTLDAGFFSYWGRLALRGAPKGGTLVLESRSGNLDRPQQNWSPWTQVKLESLAGRLASPPARFLQLRARLTQAGDGGSPELRSAEVAYLPKNVPPVVEIIEATPPNYRFQPSTLTLTSSQSLTLPPLGRRRRPAAAAPVLDSSAASMQYAKGHQGARWLASDDNGDELMFKVEIRGVQETAWKLLRDKVRERHLSWDSTAYPDGEYLLRVTASDEPGNPPGQALSRSLESEPFPIDNTPPEILELAALPSGGRLQLRFRVRDAMSVVEKAEYSLNGGDWKLAQPATRLNDSPDLAYNLLLDKPAGEEATVAVRANDACDNQSVAKVVVR